MLKKGNVDGGDGYCRANKRQNALYLLPLQVSRYCENVLLLTWPECFYRFSVGYMSWKNRSGKQKSKSANIGEKLLPHSAKVMLWPIATCERESIFWLFSGHAVFRLQERVYGGRMTNNLFANQQMSYFTNAIARDTHSTETSIPNYEDKLLI